MSSSTSFFTSFRNFSASHHKRKFFVFFVSLSVAARQYFNNSSYSSHPSAGTETHYLVPPLIDPIKNVQGHIPCYRPCRDDGIRLEVEQLDDEGNKVIFHNYGHGGSGWSTGPGTVKYVLEQLFDKEYFLNGGGNKPLTTQEPVAVIGAGVIGCYTAVGLLQRGFKNVTVFAESDQDLTSHKAAGLVGVFKAGGGGDEEKAKRLDKVAIDTFKYYVEDVLGEKQARASSSEKATLLPPSDSVRRLPRYMGDSTLSCDAEMFVSAGLMQPSRPVQVVFVDPNDDMASKSATQEKKISMFMFPDALFVDVQKIMEWLHNTLFEEKRVKKVITTIERDRDILAHHHSSSSSSLLKDYRYIFNCAGCGSKELFLDKTLHRNGGHLVELCNQGPNRNATRELNYVLDCLLIAESVQREIPGDANNKKRTCEQYLYYIPKGEGGVVGGTLVYDMEEGEPFNPKEFERILESANELFYGK